MKYKHIIWDWNGTLLDDTWLCVEGINNSLKKRSLQTITKEIYRKVFSFPVEDYYKRLGFDNLIGISDESSPLNRIYKICSYKKKK